MQSIELAAIFSLLCSLPSSLFSLCSLPSSLAAAHFSDPTSHLSLRTSHQAIHSASNPLDPVPHHPWPGGMREAIKSGHRALGATVGAVWWRWRPSYKTLPPINEIDIPLPTSTRPLPPAPNFLEFCALRLSVSVDVVRVALGLFWGALETFLGSSLVLLRASWASFAGQRVNGIGLGGRFGGAAPVR